VESVRVMSVIVIRARVIRCWREGNGNLTFNNNNNNNNNEIKTAAKIREELSQPNEKSDAKQDGIQHTR